MALLSLVAPVERISDVTAVTSCPRPVVTRVTRALSPSVSHPRALAVTIYKWEREGGRVSTCLTLKLKTGNSPGACDTHVLPTSTVTTHTCIEQQQLHEQGHSTWRGIEGSCAGHSLQRDRRVCPSHTSRTLAALTDAHTCCWALREVPGAGL